MKKSQLWRRIKTLGAAVRDYFVEEEPREKARRMMKEAADALHRVVYQRIALEHEAESGKMDAESQRWCDENLKQLYKAEGMMAQQLTALREQYRLLMLRDLFYKTINDPDKDLFEECRTALLELQASVEAERTLRNLPKLLEHSDEIDGDDVIERPAASALLASAMANGKE